MSGADNTASTRNLARLGWITTAGSVLSAFFGVQSSRARVRDFSRGSPLLFLLMALGFTAGFVLFLVILVQVMLRSAELA